MAVVEWSRLRRQFGVTRIAMMQGSRTVGREKMVLIGQSRPESAVLL